MSEIRAATGVSCDFDADDGAVLVWLHGQDRRPFAGIVMSPEQAAVLHGRLGEVVRRAEAERVAGPSPSERLN